MLYEQIAGLLRDRYEMGLIGHWLMLFGLPEAAVPYVEVPVVVLAILRLFLRMFLAGLRVLRGNAAPRVVKVGTRLARQARWRETRADSREMVASARCYGNLRAIGTAALEYRSSNRDAWPRDLQSLHPFREWCQKSLRCPSDGPGSAASYLYHAPDAPVASKKTTIICCDIKAVHAGKRNVLFADSHVQRMDDPEFQSALAQPQNASFAKALHASEP
jgi:prepilin-type processing-associated H-X9-DG protein